jgi:hypothetical protein
MKRLASISLAVFIFFCLLIATERQAYAYVDPGSGLLALQGLASGMAATAYFLRRRIMQLFTRDGSKQAIPVPAKNGGAAKAA